MKYDHTTLFARSGEILHLMATYMNKNGFTKSKVITEKNGFTLRIPNNKDNNKMLLQTLNTMKDDQKITMHSKHQLLRAFLLSEDCTLNERFGPPRRKTFLQYLGKEYRDNKIACVIGQ
jgi:hypothetical protein